MTLYCFYLYDKDMSKEEYKRLKYAGYSNKDMNALYAITNKKRYAKRFMRERNMNKFILMKKDIDSDLYTELSNARRAIVLQLYEYIYYPGIKENKPLSKTTTLLTTQMERLMVESQTDQSLLGFSETIDFRDPYCFKEEYLNELRALEYDTFYKMFIANALSFQGNEKYIPVDEDYLSPPDVLLDELQVFILNFSKYFK